MSTRTAIGINRDYHHKQRGLDFVAGLAQGRESLGPDVLDR